MPSYVTRPNAWSNAYECVFDINSVKYWPIYHISEGFQPFRLNYRTNFGRNWNQLKSVKKGCMMHSNLHFNAADVYQVSETLIHWPCNRKNYKRRTFDSKKNVFNLCGSTVICLTLKKSFLLCLPLLVLFLIPLTKSYVHFEQLS